MAERKSGPVKPPVIDLEARETGASPAPGEPAADPTPSSGAGSKPRAGRTGAKAATPAGASARSHQDRQPPPSAASQTPAADTARPAEAATPPPPPPRPPARLAMPWSAITIAAIGGAVLGAGLTYGLANWIALPDNGPATADPAPVLAELGGRAADLEARLSALEGTARNTRVSLDATLVQLDAGLAELRQSIAALADQMPPMQAIDLDPIREELRALEGRVTAIAAGASSADAAALAESLVVIEQGLETLGGRIDAIEERAGASASTLAGLAAELETAKAAIAAQNRTLGGAEIGPAVRLPLILSGLESAIANGRPYEPELSGLLALLPDLEVPPAVAAAAPTGLPRPDSLVARFAVRVPDILAGRTGESTGDWAQDAVEWAKALLALRPADEVEGATPEAIVSRLEAAVARHDFEAAAGALGELPEPMRLAAGELGEAILAHAAASRFVSTLRSQALAPAETGN